MPADPILDTAERILTEAVAALGTKVPGATFVAHGMPPDDCCDLLGVFIERMRPTVRFPAADLGADIDNGLHWALDLVVRIVRGDAPVMDDDGNFPAAEEMAAHAAAMLDDLHALRTGLRAAHLRHTLLAFPDLGIAWGGATPYGPRGGCAGWDFRLTAEVFC